jgi:PadR family transcriptional regulator, regulatory protein PadR
MSIQKELAGASAGLLVLSVLARDASYGYQIVKKLNQASEEIFEWQEGTIYPILHKLEKEDLVRTQWQQADTGRKRKYYYITAGGRDALKERAEQWEAFHGMVEKAGGLNHA